MADITMPQLGETVTEGTITRWAKQVGDRVEEDEVLFEVSTDKVDSEVPSPASGYVAEILVQEGETVDVGARLAVISDAPPSGGNGSAPAAEDAPAAAEVATAAEQQEAAAAEDAPGDDAVAQSEVAEEPQQQPADQPPGAPDAAGEGDNVQDEAQREGPEQSAPADQRPAGPTAGTRPADDRPPGRPGGGDSRILSPVVRRLIAEHNLNPDEIQGTGAGGRITRADVLALIDQRGGGQQQLATDADPVTGPADKTPAPAPSPTDAPAPQARAPQPQTQPAQPAQPQPAPQPTQPQPAQPQPAAQPAAQPVAQQQQEAPSRPAPQPGVAAGDRDEIVPFSNIRRRTAEHMVRSKATSAHTLVAIEVDYHGVEKVRARLKDRFKSEEGFSLTFLPFIARAVVDAITEFPRVNSSVGEDELIVHRYVNLGVAVDLNFEGLLVPVIKDADGKRLRALAREVSDLANRARSKRLGVDELTGGTFTITNPGPFGTFLTVPVINQPQICILSTDGIKKKPVVVTATDGSDSIAIHPVGMLALSFDHRAIDGAYASAFLAKVKDILETRDWSQEV